jgi:Domain of unknown function (DUF1836)
VLEAFTLSRKNMADLLSSLKGHTDITPIQVLQDAWSITYKDEVNAFISSGCPSIFEKILKGKKTEFGFSLNEIVSLANQIEYTTLSSSAVQNWVKRDIKELVGSPLLGKKYTVEQAATLLIVKDLKASLDFESIRKILTLVFNNPEDRSDDIIDPIDLYSAYSSVFDKVHHQPVPQIKNDGSMNDWMDQFIKDECEGILPSFKILNEENLDIVLNVLLVTALTVQAAYYQSATKRYAQAALFMQGI